MNQQLTNSSISLKPAVRALHQLSPQSQELVTSLVRQLADREGVDVPLSNIDYISSADAETLDELDTVKPPALVSMAVKIGGTRLIDNVVVG